MINPLRRNTRIAPLRRSLNRVPTVLGGERAPMILVILLSTILMFTTGTLLSVAVGLVILAAGVRGLQAAARVHPRATQVFLEFMKLRPYYAARRRFPTPMPHRRACKLGAREPLVPPSRSVKDPVALTHVDNRRRHELEPAR